MDKNIGKKLDGRYEITELIGVGGMADVYKANDVVDNKTVAIKILKKEFAENEEFLRRFRNESKAIAVLSHPNIVKIYDVGFSDRIQYIVMEYIDGITLKEYIETEKVLSWKDSVHFITQILRALQHAHSRGIVHRDIKPQNIMMFPDGTIKVMDFGIAKFAREQGKTATDQAIGTVHYISPEQARGDVTDAKSDVYSVGVMLYEMLTGQKPFDTDNPVTIAVMHMQSQAELPRSINPDIPSGLEEIIVHAMEKDPERRYASAQEMMRDIDRFKENPDIVFGYLEAVSVATATADSPTRFFKPVADPADMAAAQDYEEDDTEDEEYEYEEEEEEERRSLFVPILTAVTIIVIIVGVFLITSLVVSKLSDGGGSTKTFQMENLLGMEYEEAKEQFSEYIDLNVVAEEYSTYEVGQIFYQSVEEGSPVEKGTVVDIKVSKGVKTVTIQDVRGWEQSAGTTALTNLDLDVSISYENDEEIESGSIIRTEPEIGTEVAPRTKVLVYVSMGPNSDTVEVPNFVGMTKENAEIAAEIHELQIEFVEVDSSEEAGKVVEQDPPAKEKVTDTTVITLSVSNGVPPEGECNIKIPLPANVTGTFTFTFYEGGAPFADGTQIDTEYASGVASIKLVGAGTKEFIVQLTNNANQMSAKLGTCTVDFDKKSYTSFASADIANAFSAVNGVVVETTAVVTTAPPVVTTTKPVTTTTKPPTTTTTTTTTTAPEMTTAAPETTTAAPETPASQDGGE